MFHSGEMVIFPKRYELCRNMHLKISVVQQCGVVIMMVMKSQGVVRKNVALNIIIPRRINLVN